MNLTNLICSYLHLLPLFFVHAFTFKYEQCEKGPCQRGEFFDPIKERCQSCADQTFVELGDHRCLTCRPCRVAVGELEVILESCTNKSDASVGCRKGYSPSPGDKETLDLNCRPCSSCGETRASVRDCYVSRDMFCDDGVVVWLVISIAVALVVLVTLFVLRMRQMTAFSKLIAVDV